MTPIEQKIKNYLDGPRDYMEGLTLLTEIAPTRRFLRKMYRAADLINTSKHNHLRERIIFELEQYISRQNRKLRKKD